MPEANECPSSIVFRVTRAFLSLILLPASFICKHQLPSHPHPLHLHSYPLSHLVSPPASPCSIIQPSIPLLCPSLHHSQGCPLRPRRLPHLVHWRSIKQTDGGFKVCVCVHVAAKFHLLPSTLSVCRLTPLRCLTEPKRALTRLDLIAEQHLSICVLPVETRGRYRDTLHHIEGMQPSRPRDACSYALTH